MVKEKVVKLVEGKEKMNNVGIILKAESLWDAREALIRAGKLTEENAIDFKGPDFKNIAGYSMAGPFFVVNVDGNTQYLYPLEDIARIKIYTTDKE